MGLSQYLYDKNDLALENFKLMQWRKIKSLKAVNRKIANTVVECYKYFSVKVNTSFIELHTCTQICVQLSKY
jgi:hypothetical protein